MYCPCFVSFRWLGKMITHQQVMRASVDARKIRESETMKVLLDPVFRGKSKWDRDVDIEISRRVDAFYKERKIRLAKLRRIKQAKLVMLCINHLHGVSKKAALPPEVLSLVFKKIESEI